jgi:hypothetical protein
VGKLQAEFEIPLAFRAHEGFPLAFRARLVVAIAVAAKSEAKLRKRRASVPLVVAQRSFRFPPRARREPQFALVGRVADTQFLVDCDAPDRAECYCVGAEVADEVYVRGGGVVEE